MHTFSRRLTFIATALLVMLLVGCSSFSTNGGNANGSGPASQQAGAAATGSETASEQPTASESPAPSPTATSSPSDGNVNVPPLKGVASLRLASKTIGWTGGEGWIVRTDDAGKHWTTQWKNEGTVVRQLFALNEKQAWATVVSKDGKERKLVSTTDGGKSWKMTGTVPNEAFLHFNSEREGFSGNAATTDGGKTWTTLPTPANTVGDVYFRNGADGWAVTAKSDGKTFEVKRTSNQGKTWSSVWSRQTAVAPRNAIIRTAGKDDAWVLLVGDSGMTQTSYSLFHTSDGSKSWRPVVANDGAGSGPAPGIDPAKDKNVPRNGGNSPGALYVVDKKTAFLGGQCLACDKANTLGKTTDGGRTWTNLKPEYPGYGPQLLAAADASHVWWIPTDATNPSTLYVSTDGGTSWANRYSFAPPTPNP